MYTVARASTTFCMLLPTLLCRVTTVVSLSGKHLYAGDVWELAEGSHFDRDIDVVQVRVCVCVCVCSLHIVNCFRHKFA